MTRLGLSERYHKWDDEIIRVTGWEIGQNYIFEKPEITVSFVMDADDPSPMPETFFTYDKRYYPKKIIRSGNRTIVFWEDGTKTIVKCADDAVDNLYHAFTAALAKRVYGNNSKIKKILKEKTVFQKHGLTATEREWGDIKTVLKDVFRRL